LKEKGKEKVVERKFRKEDAFLMEWVGLSSLNLKEVGVRIDLNERFSKMGHGRSLG